MKEQNKTPGKELNEMKITNLSDAEFKTLVSVCSKNSWGTTTTLEKTQAEMKAALREIKKNLQGTNKEGKSIQSEEQEKRIKKKTRIE